MKQGSVYFQHGNLIHGSYPNRSKHHSRPTLGIMYLAKGAAFNRGKYGDRKIVEIK